MVGLTDLPVAARVERGWREAAFVEEVGSDAPHRPGLAGDPDLPVAVRQPRGPDRLFRGGPRRLPATISMEPGDDDLSGALQRLLLVAIVDLDEEIDAGARRERGQYHADRRQRGL